MQRHLQSCIKISRIFRCHLPSPIAVTLFWRANLGRHTKAWQLHRFRFYYTQLSDQTHSRLFVWKMSHALCGVHSPRPVHINRSTHVEQRERVQISRRSTPVLSLRAAHFNDHGWIAHTRSANCSDRRRYRENRLSYTVYTTMGIALVLKSATSMRYAYIRTKYQISIAYVCRSIRSSLNT